MVHSTLNELSQLKQSGFGQPWPRHGLSLLYWFSREYVGLSGGYIVPIFRPQNGDFGFHKFIKRNEEDDCIVPVQNSLSYEVGNLNFTKAHQLPPYVRKNYSHNKPDSNKDRIIVCLDDYGHFSRVYVTEHRDPKRFDSDKTYRVSQGLLRIISNFESREDFLSEVLNHREDPEQILIRPQNNARQTPNNDSWCVIL